jgi:hypothetical protein
LVPVSLAPWPPQSLSREQIVSDLEELLGSLGDVEDGARRRWIEAQVRALLAVRRDAELSLEQELEACYGVEPRPLEEAALADALPGGGPLASRYERWLAENEGPREQVAPVLRAVADSFRERTRDFVGLPDGEEIEVEVVTGERWVAFSRHLGNLRSRFSYNADLPLPAVDIPHLVAHEAYPGHHTEDAWKNVALVEGGGRVEFTVSLGVGVQPVIAEGIAQLGAELLAGEQSHEVIAETLAGRYDAAVGFGVAEARRVLADVIVNLFLLHERGAGHGELVDYAHEWSLQPPERVAKMVRGVETRPFRSSVFCYTEGLRLCRDFAGHNPARFKRLLTEQLALSDLI